MSEQREWEWERVVRGTAVVMAGHGRDDGKHGSACVNQVCVPTSSDDTADKNGTAMLLASSLFNEGGQVPD